MFERNRTAACFPAVDAAGIRQELQTIEQLKKKGYFIFTKKELEEHDSNVERARKKIIKEDIKKQVYEANRKVDAYLKEEWDKRDAIFHDPDYQEHCRTRSCLHPT